MTSLSSLRHSTIRTVNFTSSTAIALLIVGAVLSAPLAAQILTIRLINGKSGRPLSNKNVTLNWSPGEFTQNSVVYIGKDGSGKVEVPVGAEFFQAEGGPNIGKDPYLIPFLDCNAPARERVPIALVLKDGYVPRNVCSHRSAAPQPGEIVFWAMPKPWWELMCNNGSAPLAEKGTRNGQRPPAQNNSLK